MSEDRHLYDYDVDPTGDTAPARVCRMVGTGKRVLEIGAGPGSMSRVLKQRGNHVTALEVDATAIPHLAKRCDRVVQASLDEPEWPARFDEQYDAVIAADVLEHLVDPWRTLSQMKTLLAPGGVLILSVPHAAHASILACLLHEDVEYREWGLLDRTHIRFFGLKNIDAMVQKAGLRIVRGEFVVRDPRVTEFKEKWEALSEEARGFLGKQRFGQVYQVVISAAESNDPRPTVDLMQLDPASFGAEPLTRSWQSSLVDRLPSSAGNALRAIGNRVKR